jgi:hypothetical protein
MARQVAFGHPGLTLQQEEVGLRFAHERDDAKACWFVYEAIGRRLLSRGPSRPLERHVPGGQVRSGESPCATPRLGLWIGADLSGPPPQIGDRRRRQREAEQRFDLFEREHDERGVPMLQIAIERQVLPRDLHSGSRGRQAVFAIEIQNRRPRTRGVPAPKPGEHPGERGARRSRHDGILSRNPGMRCSQINSSGGKRPFGIRRRPPWPQYLLNKCSRGQVPGRLPQYSCRS